MPVEGFLDPNSELYRIMKSVGFLINNYDRRGVLYSPCPQNRNPRSVLCTCMCCYLTIEPALVKEIVVRFFIYIYLVNREIEIIEFCLLLSIRSCLSQSVRVYKSAL